MNYSDFYKKLIKPIRDSKILDIISQAGPEVYSPYDKDLTYAERLGPVNTLKETFIKWSSNWLQNLARFPFVYVMNGNTDSLNTIFSLSKSQMTWKKGDYSYYAYWHNQMKKNHKELVEPEKVEDIIVSWPGYSWGDSTQLYFAKECNPTRIHLDCAYLGLVKPMSVDVSDFETVSVSFSKTLAIPYNRIGLLFSKHEIPSLSILNSLGYVNLSGVKLATHIINHIPCDYWWSNYSNKLDKLCSDNNLKKSECLLFGYKDDVRVSLAEYWKDNLFND